MDLTLGLTVLTLLSQSGQGDVSLNSLGSLSVLVGGTPLELLVALQLALLVGQPLSQLGQNGSLLGVGLGLNTHQLVAGVGAQVVGSTVDLEGGQIGSAQVLAEVLDSGVGVPDTGDDSAGVGEDISIGVIAGGLSQLLHALHGDHTLSGVEGVVHGGEVALGVHAPVGVAAGGEEEGSGVPSVLQSVTELQAVSLAGSDDSLQAVSVFLGDDAGVVVQVVAVVGSQGICVQGAGDSTCSDGTGVVVGLDGLSSSLAGSGQGSSLHQTSQLVLCEAVDVGSGSHVSSDLGSSVGLGNALDRSVDHDAGVSSLESVDLLLSQSGNAVQLGDPQGHVVSTGQVSFLSGRGRGSGSGSSAAATSDESSNHCQSHDQCKDSFHVLPP